MTPRQQILLKAIIQEFMETAEAVGSINLPKKYDIKASPATIRNEMARLVRLGYLSKKHVSAGRTPTTTGLKYYLEELLDELEEVDFEQEARMKESIHQARYNKKIVVSEALSHLAEFTGNTAIAILEDQIFYSGLCEMLDLPEYAERVILKRILAIMEDYSILYDVFEKYKGDSDIKILLGKEIGMKELENFAVVFTEINLYRGISAYLGVIGPNRMQFEKIIPAVRSIANTIEDTLKDWN